MKIVICSSVVFSDKIIEIEKELQKLGHTVDIPFVTKMIKEKKISFEQYKKDKEKEGDIKYREALQDQVDMIKRYYTLIGDSDAILVKIKLAPRTEFSPCKKFEIFLTIQN